MFVHKRYKVTIIYKIAKIFEVNAQNLPFCQSLNIELNDKMTQFEQSRDKIHYRRTNS